METNAISKKNPKKANLLDPHSIKHLLDESVTEIVTGKGYKENVTMSNIRLFLGSIIISIALLAQFYPKKFPENKNILIGCIISMRFIPGIILDNKTFHYFFVYVILNGLLQLIIYTKEKNAILFTHPLRGSFSDTGLMISSKLPRFSDLYTLTVASADPKSLSAKKPVQLTKSVTQWFASDGFLVEGLFWKDVENLINEYTNESRKNK